MITDIRLSSHQLAGSRFDSPKELVSWMGAMQAQNSTAVKWAVGLRLQDPSARAVDDALKRGEILRTHVLRPTWHLVAAEDIRWMLKLSARRIKLAFKSYGRGLEVSEELLFRCNDLVEKALEGNKNLTKQAIGEELTKAGVIVDPHRLTYFLVHAEIDGIICSGVEKNGKQTYALLEERAAPTGELTQEEALAKLALRYFRSHSPASLDDFVWWSGLSVTEARQAVDLIGNQLLTDTFAFRTMMVHESYREVACSEDTLHLLPPFDEYLISYKERSEVLKPVHYPKAFTNYGIFYPVVMHNGQIIGNWKTVGKSKSLSVDTSFFEPVPAVRKRLLQTASERYIRFLSK